MEANFIGSCPNMIAKTGKEFVYLRVMKPYKKQAELAKRILETDDNEILNYIQAIFDTNSACVEDEMPEYVRKSIARGLKDADEGRITPHETVKKKYKKWLKK